MWTGAGSSMIGPVGRADVARVVRGGWHTHESGRMGGPVLADATFAHND